MTDPAELHALAELAADDLSRAIIEGDTRNLRMFAKAAIDSMAAFLVASVGSPAPSDPPGGP